MSNFSEDEAISPDLDETQTVPDATPHTETPSFDEVADVPPALDVPPDHPVNLLLRKGLRVFAGLVILGTALGIYWGIMPGNFDVDQKAMARALREGHVKEEGQVLPLGYTTVSTLTELAELVLDKRGGLMSNDWSPVSRITDNMRHWEKGAMVQIRIMIQGLRFNLTRIGPQSKEHPEMAAADPLFNFKETSLFVPASESQYRDGIRELNNYLKRMSTSGESQGQFFAPRQDQLIRFLDRQTIQLGNYTSRLQENVGANLFDVNALTSTTSSSSAQSGTRKANSFWKRDDVFYEVRGGVFVLYHMMLAVRQDCEVLLNNAQAMGAMNRILNELDSANKAMVSPMVLNGIEFGVLQNHSLVLASHLARAHLAIQELQNNLAGGTGTP